MIKRLNYIALFVLILIGNVSSFSQSNPKIDSIISSYIVELTSTWNNYNAITFSDLLSDNEKKNTNLSSKTDASVTNTRLNLLLKRNALQQAILKKDKGFSLNAAYQYNFSPSFIDAEDVVVFRQRATFGAEWDILKAGFYESYSNHIAYSALVKPTVVKTDSLRKSYVKISFKEAQRIDKIQFAIDAPAYYKRNAYLCQWKEVQVTKKTKRKILDVLTSFTLLSGDSNIRRQQKMK